jgi:hypothetical protein
MQLSTPNPELNCGRCAKFEPARYEPANDVKYGYCKPHMAQEQDRRGFPHPRLVDVSTTCFMVMWHGNEPQPAFEEKK